MADPARATLQIVDDVARRMTEGDAPADLRARVMQQLAPVRRTPWRRGTLVNSGIAASVAALFVVGVIWSRRDVPSVAPTAIASNPEPSAAVSQNVAAAPASESRVSRQRPRPQHRQVTLPGLPVLEAPAAIELEAIQPQRLSIPQLTVAPIVTEPLRVAADGGGSQR